MAENERSPSSGLASRIAERFLLAMAMLSLLTAIAPEARAVPPSSEFATIYQPIIRSDSWNVTSGGTGPLAKGGFMAAPVPNEDAIVPSEFINRGATLAPVLAPPRKADIGDGFTPNSAIPNSQTPKHMLVPMISLKVPLY
jgi:hypothetical protein